jgi:hypothetical protein
VLGFHNSLYCSHIRNFIFILRIISISISYHVRFQPWRIKPSFSLCHCRALRLRASVLWLILLQNRTSSKEERIWATGATSDTWACHDFLRSCWLISFGGLHNQMSIPKTCGSLASISPAWTADANIHWDCAHYWSRPGNGWLLHNYASHIYVLTIYLTQICRPTPCSQ